MNDDDKQPSLTEAQAVELADMAWSDPLGAVDVLNDKEQNVYIESHFFRGEWRCSVTFAWATYGATGRAKTLGEALQQAILRAYDAGDETGWQQAKGWAWKGAG